MSPIAAATGVAAAAASASSSPFVQLAKRLPRPLQRFLARWPPASIHPNPEKAKPTLWQKQRQNPFRPYKHAVTGRWQGAAYSLRNQAELMRLAHQYGVAELMPESGKDPQRRLAKRVELGLRVKGTGVGQKVKGHFYERHMITKTEQKRKAMLVMPKLIKQFKRLGKRRWKKFPSS